MEGRDGKGTEKVRVRVSESLRVVGRKVERGVVVVLVVVVVMEGGAGRQAVRQADGWRSV